MPNTLGNLDHGQAQQPNYSLVHQNNSEFWTNSYYGWGWPQAEALSQN